MIISSDIDFFDMVFLKTDTEQNERLVTEIKVMPGNVLLYGLVCGISASWHYREEFTKQKDEVKIIS